jgi:small subunit ribosomal protein S6
MERMNFYDLMVIFSPSSEKRDETVKEIDDVLKEKEGRLERLDEWGVRKLSYPIKKQEKGFYLLIRFAAPPHSIQPIEEVLRAEESVLRFLVTRRKKALSDDKEEVKEIEEEKDEGILASNIDGESDKGS